MPWPGANWGIWSDPLGRLSRSHSWLALAGQVTPGQGRPGQARCGLGRPGQGCHGLPGPALATPGQGLALAAQGLAGKPERRRWARMKFG